MPPKVTARRGSKPGPAAKALQKFITDNGFSIRAASYDLDVSHPALIAWLGGKSDPSAIHRKKIAIWTSGKIPEDAWLSKDELEELAEMKPASGPGDAPDTKPTGTGGA